MNKPNTMIAISGTANGTMDTWSLYKSVLVDSAGSLGLTYHEGGVDGRLVGISWADFLNELGKLSGAHLAYSSMSAHWLKKTPTLLFRSERFVAYVSSKDEGAVYLSYATYSDELATKTEKFLAAHVREPLGKGRTCVLVNTSYGLSLRTLGMAGEPFVPENYDPKIVEDYQHVVKDLKSAEPCGRVVILDGEPGTGKTRMIRAMINEVSEATTILVPSQMAGKLGEPGFLNVLIDNRRKGHPIILLIEDADACLASRKADNESDISALLNFGDGIFGSQLDLRIIATTNRSLKDLDYAVKRPRRLCRRIEVGRLGHEQAQKVYERLGGKGTVFTKGYFTLAEAYAAAHPEGAQQEAEKPRGRVGFMPEPGLKAKIEKSLDDMIATTGKVIEKLKSGAPISEKIGVMKDLVEELRGDEEVSEEGVLEFTDEEIQASKDFISSLGLDRPLGEDEPTPPAGIRYPESFDGEKADE